MLYSMFKLKDMAKTKICTEKNWKKETSWIKIPELLFFINSSIVSFFFSFTKFCSSDSSRFICRFFATVLVCKVHIHVHTSIYIHKHTDWCLIIGGEEVTKKKKLRNTELEWWWKNGYRQDDDDHIEHLYYSSSSSSSVV